MRGFSEDLSIFANANIGCCKIMESVMQDVTLQGIGDGERSGCLCHALCYAGECRFIWALRSPKSPNSSNL